MQMIPRSPLRELAIWLTRQPWRLSLFMFSLLLYLASCSRALFHVFALVPVFAFVLCYFYYPWATDLRDLCWIMYSFIHEIFLSLSDHYRNCVDVLSFLYEIITACFTA